MKQKIKTIDLFAGCGGLMDGFEQSNLYTTLACVEWEKAPCDNLRKRLSDKWQYKDAYSRVLRFDIQRTTELFGGWANDKDYGSSKGLDALVGNNTIDLIIGGPPCQAYSIAGRIRDEHNMKNDYRNYLFESYLKVVCHYNPKAFVFENVPGILSAKPSDRYIIDIIKERFEQAGYVVLDNLRNAIIDFTDYGVPQNRSRIIILGLSNKTYPNAKELLEKFYNEILPKYKVRDKATVRQAIGDLPKLYPLINNESQKYSHTVCASEIENHLPRWHSRRDIEIFRLLTEDIEQRRFQYVTTESLKRLYTEKTGKVSNVHKYHVLRWDEPSNLIPAHLYKDGLRHIHPDSTQARTITVREAARLQTFADDYVFVGSQMDQFKMIGNAVPPLFSKKLAQAIYELLFENQI